MKASTNSMAMRMDKREWIDLRVEKEAVSYRFNIENKPF